MAAAETSSGGGEVHVPIPPMAATTSDVIREGSAAPSPFRSRGNTPPRQLKAAPAAAVADDTPATAMDKTLASVANLAKLLPTGTALAFQSLSPSFTNRGACLPSNRDGKLYYGVATVKGFLVFNYTGDDDEGDAERRRQVFKNLRRLRIRWVDYVHAVFSAVVFLTVAFSTVAVQNCFFPDASENVNQMLTNLPLGAGFFSAMVFLVFPTTRKGIDYTGPFTNV
ncbi:protein DMP3-like isoform X2 [Miscanthus floridulus]|uniref:protein DMP3-like isoform X2 n=1 Tax=Miscanthus floridulus TaxID=154761 RepID=UPI0034580B36